MTKEQLRQYIPMKREQRHIEQRLQALERRPASDQEALRSLREQYQAKLAELVQAQLAIERALETLEPVERDLARLRYIDGKPWHQVEAAIHYGRTQTHRIHKRMLRKLERI